MKKLGICIPTYNRAKLLDRLLESITYTKDIIVSICDDGSKDDTYKIIKRHQTRISIIYNYQENSGRASALRKSILNCEAEFLMLVDSDDYFEKKGIQNIYECIKKNSAKKFFVFPIRIKIKNKFKNVSLSGISETNYISLRADYKIRHDLQEVINKNLLLDVLYKDPVNIKRIPTSYLWFKASEREKCLPIDISPVKIKEYLNDGMSNNLLPLKVNYPKYLVDIYKIALNCREYQSLLYRIKCKILFYRYSFHNKNFKLTRYSDFLFYFVGYVIGLSDILRLVIFFKKKLW